MRTQVNLSTLLRIRKLAEISRRVPACQLAGCISGMVIPYSQPGLG